MFLLVFLYYFILLIYTIYILQNAYVRLLFCNVIIFFSDLLFVLGSRGNVEELKNRDSEKKKFPHNRD